MSHGNEHHSILSFEGYTLENHWTVLDVNAHKSSRYLEELLEKWAAEHREHIVMVLPYAYLRSALTPSICYATWSMTLLRSRPR